MGIFEPMTTPLTVIVGLLFLAGTPGAYAQWGGRDGWVEEPATKSLNVEGDPGHSYLDPASIHRGDDGLVYFNESNAVTKPEEVGHSGFMKNAYDCTRNIKYMCVGIGDWRNDRKSAIDTKDDPALQVYRRYLCSDGDTAPPDSSAAHAQSSH